MHAKALLRTFALQDLKRHIPPAHYLLREHDPKADHELAYPLLQHPVGFELTPREHAAAQALADMATHELRFREFFARAYPVRDASAAGIKAGLHAEGMTENEQRELTARAEVFRRSALVYARLIDNQVLIEAYQPKEDAAAANDIAATLYRQRTEKVTTVRDDAIIAALRARGIDPKKMPSPPSGNKPWPLREEIRQELKLTTVQAKEAFTRLRKEGRMGLQQTPRS